MGDTIESDNVSDIQGEIDKVSEKVREETSEEGRVGEEYSE